MASGDAMIPMQIADHPAQMRTEGGATAYFRKLWRITRKELQTELRAREAIGAMAAFSVLAVVIFGLAFDLAPRMDLIVPGILWGILLFAGVLGLNRSFGAEVDKGSLAALLLAPMDRSAVYFGKVLANFLFILATQVIVLPIMLVIFDINLFRLWILVGLFLGILGYVFVGTLFAALTVSVRARESMLPILLLPVMMPLFVAGVGLTALVLNDREFGDFDHWLLMLATYDIIFLVIAYMVFDLIWEDV